MATYAPLSPDPIASDLKTRRPIHGFLLVFDVRVEVEHGLVEDVPYEVSAWPTNTKTKMS